MKFKPGDLVYDPNYKMVGMITGTRARRARARRRSLGDTTPQAETELWYQVMLFGDSWCAKGNTRDYTVQLADNLLEIYNEEEHKGLTRDEAEHKVDDISRVFIDL
mgnify:CR=1 FL=1